jgi:pentatricopeptide repeat protein
LLRYAPELAENVFALAGAAQWMNRPREVLTCLERLAQTREPAEHRSGCWNLMMHAHHQLGQYREALQLIDRMRADSLDEPLFDRYRIRQWAALGDVERVNTLIDQRVAKSSQLVTAGSDMAWGGEELRAHGHIAEGRALCARGVAWSGNQPASEQAKLGFRVSLAGLLYCAERWTEARVAYARLAAEDSSSTYPGITYRTRLGAIAARQGDSAEVARIDRWLADRDSLPFASAGRAVLAAAQGDFARALGLFQVDWERASPNFPAAHADPALEPLRDYPPFRALLHAAR